MTYIFPPKKKKKKKKNIHPDFSKIVLKLLRCRDSFLGLILTVFLKLRPKLLVIIKSKASQA